jgi:hypothetical protein
LKRPADSLFIRKRKAAGPGRRNVEEVLVCALVLISAYFPAVLVGENKDDLFIILEEDPVSHGDCLVKRTNSCAARDNAGGKEKPGRFPSTDPL